MIHAKLQLKQSDLISRKHFYDALICENLHAPDLIHKQLIVILDFNGCGIDGCLLWHDLIAQRPTMDGPMNDMNEM